MLSCKWHVARCTLRCLRESRHGRHSSCLALDSGWCWLFSLANKKPQPRSKSRQAPDRHSSSNEFSSSCHSSSGNSGSSGNELLVAASVGSCQLADTVDVDATPQQSHFASQAIPGRCRSLREHKNIYITMYVISQRRRCAVALAVVVSSCARLDSTRVCSLTLPLPRAPLLASTLFTFSACSHNYFG